ncbi:DUF3783 domain-containing protein [Acutalibacter muris]|uniref:DUF3783 domain-containing protein n=1 Tax=Acutalibacter muris TaxID=1796620 RepID=UPI00137307C2
MNNMQILLFHVEPLKAAHIESLCKNLGIRTSQIKHEDYSQKLAYLAGIPGFPRENTDYTGPEFPSEMMVFANMADMLDRFLSEYKKAGIPPIGLKAVVTPHNIFWSAVDLYEELFKEHQAFQKK